MQQILGLVKVFDGYQKVSSIRAKVLKKLQQIESTSWVYDSDFKEDSKDDSSDCKETQQEVEPETICGHVFEFRALRELQSILVQCLIHLAAELCVLLVFLHLHIFNHYLTLTFQLSLIEASSNLHTSLYLSDPFATLVYQ